MGVQSALYLVDVTVEKLALHSVCRMADLKDALSDMHWAAKTAVN